MRTIAPAFLALLFLAGAWFASEIMGPTSFKSEPELSYLSRIFDISNFPPGKKGDT